MKTGGPAMNGNDHRISLCRIEVFRIEQPALHALAFVLPYEAFRLAPARMLRSVRGSQLCPVSDRSRDNFRRLLPCAADGCARFAILRNAEVRKISIFMQRLVALPECLRNSVRKVERCNSSPA